MYQAIPNNADLFDPSVVDELNTALSRTNDRIEQFHPKNLEYKATLSDYKVLGIDCTIQNSSIQVDNEVWVTVIIKPNRDISKDSNILELPDIPPAIISSTLCEYEKPFDSIPIQSEGRYIKTIGNLHKNTDYLLSFFFIKT